MLSCCVIRFFHIYHHCIYNYTRVREVISLPSTPFRKSFIRTMKISDFCTRHLPLRYAYRQRPVKMYRSHGVIALPFTDMLWASTSYTRILPVIVMRDTHRSSPVFCLIDSVQRHSALIDSHLSACLDLFSTIPHGIAVDFDLLRGMSFVGIGLSPTLRYFRFHVLPSSSIPIWDYFDISLVAII